jgi:predicted enzyme related to lactoylglutathione lyase
MRSRAPNPVVHLELHTGDLPRACAFYAELCGWRPERIDAGGGSYWALELGAGFGGGGVVECDSREPLWLPYVAVTDVGRSGRRLLAAEAMSSGPQAGLNIQTQPKRELGI